MCIREKLYYYVVWYDILPTGQWWDYAVKHIPNLLMVYRETPTKIFNKTIKIPEHKSDITRLEAVLVLGKNNLKQTCITRNSTF